MSVQHEVLPRVSVEVGYFRRWFQGFLVTDNLAVTPTDFAQFSVVAPADSRLPGGGGNTSPGAVRRQPVAVRRDEQLRHVLRQLRRRSTSGSTASTSTSTPGPQRPERSRAASASAKSTSDNCEVRAKLPETVAAEPVLPRRDGLPAAVQGARQLHDPEDRRPDERRRSPASRASRSAAFGTPAGIGGIARRQLHRAELR